MIPDKDRVIELLKIEHECVRRNSEQQCDGNCSACDLVQDDKDLLAAYDRAVELLSECKIPRLLSINDFMDGLHIPTVLWLELREKGVLAGVWQFDHYEMEGGTVFSDIGLEFAEHPEAYNTKWRVWTAEPNDAIMAAYPWDDNAAVEDVK